MTGSDTFAAPAPLKRSALFRNRPPHKDQQDIAAITAFRALRRISRYYGWCLKINFMPLPFVFYFCYGLFLMLSIEIY
ncbi:MAG: hypothetical protein CVU71_15300 [Deltaproteobacteria bacterium HGW-Deltaproteobacteria-6]|nr:MAG: hypothetical protein CVU71_15300 [Deltaproteobacteria bacterium HGW-Deltaproteobacteria-6]